MLLKRIGAVILLLAVVAFFTSIACEADTRPIQFELRYYYDISEILGELVYQLREIYQREYNRKGNLISGYSYDSEKRLRRKNVYEYDETGNQIGASAYDSGGNLLERGIYKYDTEGNRIEENLYESSGMLKAKLVSTYDDYGNMLQTNYYRPNGTRYYVRTYEYDHKGNKTKQVSRLLEDDFAYEMVDVYAYNNGGNMVEEVMYGVSGGEERLLSRRVYEYDERGDEIKETYYRGDSVNDIDYRYIYTRNASGDVLEDVYYTYKFAFGELQEIPERKSIYEYYYFENNAKTE